MADSVSCINSEAIAWSVAPTPSRSEIGIATIQALGLLKTFRSFDDPYYLCAPQAFYSFES